MQDERQQSEERKKGQGEEQRFPAEWLRAVSRGEEKRKPAVFYYVDMSRLFTDGEQMLIKIRDVLQVFEENRDDVVVLWHQDPFIKKYLPQQKPAVWERYQELVREFLAADYGILDDTSEDDAVYFAEIQENYPGPAPTPGERRAIAFCSAFYGDGGYLSNCFRNESKPVMLQAPEILAHREFD